MKERPDINDTLRDEGADAVRDRHDKAHKYEPENDSNGRDEAPPWEEARGEAPPDEAYGEPNSGPTPPILSKSDFLKGFVPPDYIVDGMLQRRFVYALTGQTGHLKTAIALVLAHLIAADQDASFGTHHVEKGRVVYFVGENPDDIRIRVIGSDALRSDDPSCDRISFIPGVFDIRQMQSVLAVEMEKLGGVDLIIVDTSAAYFLGQDENVNPQIGAHARMLRKLTELPGGPCVLVLCHPIKYTTDPSQLLPRGGGAFLAEMDGNLTSWRHDESLVELHHNKIRGPGFEPMTFRIEKITTPKLADSKGRLISTVRAVAISDQEEETQSRQVRDDEDTLLAALLKDADRSVAELARACDWILLNGEPHKSKVHRSLDRLEKAKFLKKKRGRCVLTKEGKDVARKAALRFGREAAEGA